MVWIWILALLLPICTILGTCCSTVLKAVMRITLFNICKVLRKSAWHTRCAMRICDKSIHFCKLLLPFHYCYHERGVWREITEQFCLFSFPMTGLWLPLCFKHRGTETRSTETGGALKTPRGSFVPKRGEVVLCRLQTMHFVLKCPRFIFQLFYVLCALSVLCFSHL